MATQLLNKLNIHILVFRKKNGGRKEMGIHILVSVLVSVLNILSLLSPLKIVFTISYDTKKNLMTHVALIMILQPIYQNHHQCPNGNKFLYQVILLVHFTTPKSKLNLNALLLLFPYRVIRVYSS